MWSGTDLWRQILTATSPLEWNIIVLQSRLADLPQLWMQPVSFGSQLFHLGIIQALAGSTYLSITQPVWPPNNHSRIFLNLNLTSFLSKLELELSTTPMTTLQSFEWVPVDEIPSSWDSWNSIILSFFIKGLIVELDT